MARLFSIKPGITFKGRTFKGLRGFAGKPLHPPLTDIPVGAYVLAAVFDVISFFSSGDLGGNMYHAATYALIGGFIVSIPTSLTGFWDWLKSTPKHTQAWRTANWHMAVMLTVTALVVINLLARAGDDGGVNAVGLILSLIAGSLVGFGATYGGSLVFDYGFNVETSGDHAVWHESEEDVYPGHDKHPA
ncbi:MAG: DUF2231 domain-containing protein [Actinomycetota bacterium]|jgi:uncharacterized membrane protein